MGTSTALLAGEHQASRRLAFALCCRARTSPLTCSCPRVPQENAISAEIVSDGLIKEDLMEELALTELECDAVLLGCV